MGEDGTVGARRSVLRDLLHLVEQLERPDLVPRLEALEQRIERPDVVVCVVGEFKQGKSSLVNAVLDERVCPVDDDLATAALTVVEYRDPPSTTIHHRDATATTRDEIGLDDLASWVTESENAGNAKRVERAEVGIPNLHLAGGLTLVDTPGIGGLGAGYAIATLAFLPFADAVLFVTDVSTELSEPELEYLERARELCSTVLLVETKTDLYPAWPRIVEINQGHLDARDINVLTMPVSSVVHAAALARHDEGLDERSGIPGLVAYLDSSVVRPAREAAVTRCDADLYKLTQQLRSGLRTQRELLQDPGARDAALAALAEADTRLEHLRGPGAQWSDLLTAQFDDLSKIVAHEFRSELRRITRELDERIEQSTTADEWDELGSALQAQVAEAMSAGLVAIADGAAAAERSALDLIAESDLELLTADATDGALDVRSLWRAAPIESKDGAAAKAIHTGWASVVGAAQGITMLASLCRALPAAAALMVLANPVVLGVGVLFGGVELFEERRRRIAARRQAARIQMHEFLDDVEFELVEQLETAVRKIESDLGVQLRTRLTELQASYAETVRRATADAERAADAFPARIAQIGGYLKALDAIEATLRGDGGRS